MLNGDAHHWLEADGELRIRPLPYVVLKDWNARNISQMPLTILHVEDYKVVADAVRDTLEAEGWRVVTCADGAAAVSRLAGPAPFDLLITDNHLPHVNGLEVVRYARRLEHRARLPVVMFTGVDCRGDARRAGVDVFLRKPEDIKELVPTVTRLLHRGA
jgi:two-component system chemotaxis response regulator CheY